MKVNRGGNNTGNKAYENAGAVRELINSAIRLNGGAYIIEDAEPNLIYVNVIEGKVGQVTGVTDGGAILVDYGIEGEDSEKKNGYLYQKIVVSDGEGSRAIKYGKHSLIAMLAYTNDFDYIYYEAGKIPIPNHENNMPWDNRAVNLSYSSNSGNVRHGKIVNALEYHYPGKYTYIANNMSDTDFVVTKQLLRIKHIAMYSFYMENNHGIKNVFKCGNNEIISRGVIDGFVNWLISRGHWKEDVKEA